jgi:hypothetical protein
MTDNKKPFDLATLPGSKPSSIPQFGPSEMDPDKPAKPLPLGKNTLDALKGCSTSPLGMVEMGNTLNICFKGKGVRFEREL